MPFDASTATNPKSIFLLGATGYIGGSVLTELVKAYPDAKIFLQYRSDDHLDRLQAVGKNIEPIKATLQDTEILKEYAAKSDLVVNCADCDDLPSTTALLVGLEEAGPKRVQEKKLKAVYIHTSGTGELIDHSVKLGELDETVYDDANIDQISSLPDDRDHRKVSLQVIHALERGHFLGYIILPATIYGRGTGPINQISQQIPNTVDFALKRERAAYVKPGQNVWSNVTIWSLSKLFLQLAQLLLSPSAPPPPHNGNSHYIFAVSKKPHSWKAVAEQIGDTLKALGEIKEGGAVGLSEEEIGPGMRQSNSAGGSLTGTTSVAVSHKAKELVGWVDEDRIEDFLKKDVLDVLARAKAAKKA